MQLLGLAERREVRLERRRTGAEFSLADAVRELVDGVHIKFVGSPHTEGSVSKRIVLVEVSELGRERLHERLGSLLWIEEPIRHDPQQNRQLAIGRGAPVEVEVLGSDGQPLPHSYLTVFAAEDDGTSWNRTFRADALGRCRFQPDSPVTVLEMIVTPLDGYWTTVAVGGATRIVCQAIVQQDGGIGWWHQVLGFSQVEPGQGAGMRVGIIDTGCRPHAALRHVTQIGTFGRNSFAPEDYSTSGHGTHVCGILGAHTVAGRGYWGLAPGAELLVATVTNDEAQWDIANAVCALSEDHAIPLINISLGAPLRSRILAEAIEDAADLGCVCICAAGNSRGDVLWPARLPNAVAVSAIGSRADHVEGTFAATRLPPLGDGEAGDAAWPLAVFSCRGPEVNCCGPGVGIVSTHVDSFGHEGWVDFSGTSMAAPAVCGALAVHLARSATFRNLPADASRAAFIWQALDEICRSLDLPADQQGRGMPFLGVAADDRSGSP